MNKDGKEEGRRDEGGVIANPKKRDKKVTSVWNSKIPKRVEHSLHIFMGGQLFHVARRPSSAFGGS